MFRSLLLLVLALAATPCAAQEHFSLYCGRGTPDYPDADLTMSATGSHTVRVVFVGYRPSRGRADWSLRDCLNTAARYAGSKDIVATLWYRERDDRQPREALAPYGATYNASTKTVVVHHQKVAAN